MHDVIISRIVFLLQLFKCLFGGCRTYSSTHVETSPGLSIVINTRYVFSRNIQCTIYDAYAKILRPITCLSFRDMMHLAQKFVEFACYKTISVTELDLNRKYRILIAKRHTTKFDPILVLTIRDSGSVSAISSYIGDTVMS